MRVLVALLIILTTCYYVDARRRRPGIPGIGMPGEEEEPLSEADIRREKYYKRVHNKFMNDVFLRSDVVKLKSGLMFEKIKSTDADFRPHARSPTLDDKCMVSYISSTRNGTVFENDTKERTPAQVIEGWKQALQLMAEGDRWKLYMPYNLAFGEDGIPNKIEPFSPLVYELELVTVLEGGKTIREARAMLEEALLPPERDPTSLQFDPDWKVKEEQEQERQKEKDRLEKEKEEEEKAAKKKRKKQQKVKSKAEEAGKAELDAHGEL